MRSQQLRLDWKVEKKRDLRKMSELEFRNVFKYLKKETENFSTIPSELILKNSQYLLVFRLCLGLSQKELAKKLGRFKDNIRHIESGRRKITRLDTADYYSYQLEMILPLDGISLENALDNWKKYKFISTDQILPEPEIRLKQISRMDENDFKGYFKLIKKETRDFTVFDPAILSRIPQSILIFRIVLGIDHRKFAQVLGICSRGLRKYETLRMKIKPETAKRVMNVISKLFRDAETELNYRTVLENFRILTGFFGHRNLDAMINQGVYKLGKRRSVIEEEIFSLLKEERIPIQRNSVIEGIKKKFNVDFVIPDMSSPRIVMEAFIFKGKKTNNWKSKVCNIDHRFQALKMKHRNLITIMIIKFMKPMLYDHVKRSIEKEILNTDIFLINNDIKRLPQIIDKFTTE